MTLDHHQTFRGFFSSVLKQILSVCLLDNDKIYDAYISSSSSFLNSIENNCRMMNDDNESGSSGNRQ